jgi:hypothetical protein
MTITLTDGGIDGGVSPAPQHYMIGWLYPTHAQTALRALRAARPDLVTRVRGLKANASPLSPDELDKLDRLAATIIKSGRLGGCCGTDQRYIEALAKAAQVSLRGKFSEKCHKFRLA